MATHQVEQYYITIGDANKYPQELLDKVKAKAAEEDHSFMIVGNTIIVEMFDSEDESDEFELELREILQ